MPPPYHRAVGLPRPPADHTITPAQCRPRPATLQAQPLAAKVPGLSLAALVSLFAAGGVQPAAAADFLPPQQATEAATAERPQSLELGGAQAAQAPALVGGEYALPEGAQWRYSEFIEAVQRGKVERVRFSKDGTQLQLTAVDGRRAIVVGAVQGRGGPARRGQRGRPREAGRREGLWPLGSRHAAPRPPASSAAQPRARRGR